MSKLANAMTEVHELTAYERFRAQVERLRPEIAALVGRDRVDKFIRIALNAVQANPDVLGADRRSLLIASLEAAQDGLMPDGNEAVFNIYRTKDREKSKLERRDVYVQVVQYLPMVYGLVQLIYEAGAKSVDAVAVYERDTFKYQRGDDPKIEHLPYDGEEDPGKVVAAYVVVKLPSGELKREVMFRRDIERVRLKSKQPEGLMWAEFYDQGAIKSVIHRVFKQLPRSERLERALAHDNAAIGLAEIKDTPAVSADLVALVDGRMDQELRTIAMRSRESLRTGAAGAEGAEPGQKGGDPKGSHGATEAGGNKGETPPAPKAGDPGTPEMKIRFLAQIDGAADPMVLSIIEDDIGFYSWSGPELADLMTAIDRKRQSLPKAGA